jgi:hypothetical protein
MLYYDYIKYREIYSKPKTEIYVIGLLLILLCNGGHGGSIISTTNMV